MPNAATSPGVWCVTIASSAARLSSGCRAIVPGLTLSMWSVSRVGAAFRTDAKSSSTFSGTGAGYSTAAEAP